jgi:two-component system, cell cycle response regulator DivK
VRTTPDNAVAPHETPLILVAEDDDDSRLLYVEYLQMMGYRAVPASNGVEAIKKTHGLHPHVVVMDMSMPDMDGFEATRILKRDRSTRDVRIIALTGHGEDRFREAAASAGVDCYLVKPCTTTDLFAALTQCLRSTA